MMPWERYWSHETKVELLYLATIPKGLIVGHLTPSLQSNTVMAASFSEDVFQWKELDDYQEQM